MLNKVEVVLNDIIDNRKEVLPIGEQPEGNLDPLGKLEAVMKSLFKNIDGNQSQSKNMITIY